MHSRKQGMSARGKKYCRLKHMFQTLLQKRNRQYDGITGDDRISRYKKRLLVIIKTIRYHFQFPWILKASRWRKANG